MKEDFNIALNKELLAEMPLVEFDGEITVADTPEAAREALEYLSMQKTVGFDTETRPNFRKGQNHLVALIQISTETRSFLFRICTIGLMPEITAFMENPEITKIGLSLKDDFHNLHKISEFSPEGFIELQQMVRDYRISDSSLQKIYGILFDQRISKGQRLSNWEAPELTEAQQRYAAIDAWACLEIYNRLSAGDFDPVESPYKVYPEPELKEE